MAPRLGAVGSRVCTDCEREFALPQFPISIHDPTYEWQIPICTECTNGRRRHAKERSEGEAPARAAALAERNAIAQARKAAEKAERAERRRQALTPSWRKIGEGVVGVLLLVAMVVALLGLVWLQSEVRHGLFGDNPPCDNTYRVDCPE